MTPEQINIAIAEFCGLNPYRWKFIYQHEEGFDVSCGYESLLEAEREWKELYDGPEHAKPIERYISTPNYYGDLNAIHAAILSLPQGKIDRFAMRLMDLAPLKQCEVWSVATMEAPQLCEALLRTIGKWEKAT